MPRAKKKRDIPRLGLCCQFVDEPIKFRTTTATSLLRLDLENRRRKLSDLCLANASALLSALKYCAENGIGCFRIGSSILPIKTHPQAGYKVEDLPDADAIVAGFQACGEFARKNDVRTVFHPDQFVVLNSPREEVVVKSLEELEYQAEVAEWTAADAINVHAGGAYGDKQAALATLARNVDRLSEAVRSRLTFENDDTTYTPRDLLPFCRSTALPLVYDVHHHRCLPDGMTVEDATAEAIATWNREPLLHLSSPIEGWSGPRPQRHHDFIDAADFPACWRTLAVTIEVEAKAKERAVLQLRDQLLTKLSPR